MVTLVGITGEQMEGMGQAALTLAPQLGVGPAELASTAYFVLSNGITDVGKAMEVTTLAAKAQAVGLGDAETVARIVTAAIQSYGEENITAAQATDQLLRAVQLGAVEAEEFAEPLGRMLGLAANLGVSFAEATGFITVFTSSGISASQAVTGLNRVMASFLKPTAKAKEALAEIGLTSETALELLGEHGLGRTLTVLRERFEAAGVPVADYIGRVTGLNAALFNTGEAGDRYINTVDEITEANGTLERSFEVVQETTSFQFNQLKASLQVAAITIGSILLPAINAIIKRLLPLIAGVAEFAKQHPKIVLMAAAFGLVALVIGPLVVAMGLFISSLGIMATAIGAVLTLITSLVAWPIVLVSGLVLAAATIGGLFVASLRKMRTDLDWSLSGIAKRAFEWGKNIVISLARGIAAATIAVVKALISLGKTIAKWLGPGSPPRIAPDIDDWGTSAMNEFLRGFSAADFDIFNEIGSTVSSFFRGLEGGGIAKEGIVPAILGSRSATAQAIAQFKATGTVSEDVLRRIAGSFGRVSNDVREYTLTLLRLNVASKQVALAQAEIERINERFSSSVKPLNDELKSITDRYDEIKLAQEKQRLEAILDDPRAPELAKELALLGLRELELKGQISQEEKQRDIALEAANARLDAAKAEEERLSALAESQKAFIEAQLETNSLFKEQADLIESIIDSIGGLGDKLDELGEFEPPDFSGFGLPDDEGDGTGFDPADFEIPSLADIIGEGLGDAAANVGLELQGLWETILGFFAPLQALWDELTTVWAGVFTTLMNWREIDWVAVGQRIVEDIVRWAVEFDWVGAATTLVQKFLGPILGFNWSSIGLNIIAGIWGPLSIHNFFETAKNVVLRLMEGFFALVLEIDLLLLDVLSRVAEWARGADWLGFGKDAAEFILDGLLNIVEFYLDVLPEWYQNIIDWANSIDWRQYGYDIATFILNGLRLIWEFVTVVLPEMWQAAKEWFSEQDWPELGRKVVDGIIEGIKELTITLFNKMRDIGAGMKAAWDDFWAGRSPSRLMMESAGDIMEGFTIGLRDSLPEMSNIMSSAGMMAQQAFVSGTAGTTQANSFAFNTTINNGMDQAVFEARVRRIVAEAI
jgi:TP901 family phage tail tape measure protein